MNKLIAIVAAAIVIAFFISVAVLPGFIAFLLIAMAVITGFIALGIHEGREQRA